MTRTREELEAEKRRLLFRLKKSFIESRSMQGSPTYSSEYASGRGWESDRLSLERVERELQSLEEQAVLLKVGCPICGGTTELGCLSKSKAMFVCISCAGEEV